MLNKSQIYPFGEFSAFQQKLTAEGYEVEAYARQLIQTCADHHKYEFQRVFETSDLLAKADMVRTNDDGSIDLYEVKSSTRVKDSYPDNQLKDAAFQAIVAEYCGHDVGNIFIVHLNKSYQRNGVINAAELLTFADETVRVKALFDKIKLKIAAALKLLNEDSVDETSCSCLCLGNTRHCNSFDYFNPAVPKPSIYTLPYLSGGKLGNFVSEGRFGLDQIETAEVSQLQAMVLRAHQSGAPLIDKKNMEKFLGALKFPLYFLDYEGFGSAIPICDGASPQVQFPFQYSLHVMQSDGSLEHHEYLADEAKLPLELVQGLEQCIGPIGSIISWHKTYENTRNKEMAVLYPDKANFLNDLTSRMVDLEDVFKTGYVDIAFEGSTSIKKVLPVIVPDLSYEDMEIGDGTAAMDGWKKMLNMPFGEDRDAKRAALLEYCKLDTLAMVRIHQFVDDLVAA